MGCEDEVCALCAYCVCVLRVCTACVYCVCVCALSWAIPVAPASLAHPPRPRWGATQAFVTCERPRGSTGSVPRDSAAARPVHQAQCGAVLCLPAGCGLEFPSCTTPGHDLWEWARAARPCRAVAREAPCARAPVRRRALSVRCKCISVVCFGHTRACFCSRVGMNACPASTCT